DLERSLLEDAPRLAYTAVTRTGLLLSFTLASPAPDDLGWWPEGALIAVDEQQQASGAGVAAAGSAHVRGPIGRGGSGGSGRGRAVGGGREQVVGRLIGVYGMEVQVSLELDDREANARPHARRAPVDARGGPSSVSGALGAVPAATGGASEAGTAAVAAAV